MQSKYLIAKNWMNDREIDCLVVTETWLAQQAGGTTKPWEADDQLVSLASQKKNPLVAGRNHGDIGLICSEKMLRLRQTETIAIDTDARWACWKVAELWVVGVYLSPSMNMEEIRIKLLEISETIYNAPSGTPIIICGDLNASFAHADGEYRDNERGLLIRSWALDYGLKIVLPRHKQDYQTTVGRTDGRNGWKDIFLTNVAGEEILIAGAQADYSQDAFSDHRPILCDLKPIQEIVQNDQVTLQHRWKLSKLSCPETLGRYTGSLRDLNTALCAKVQCAEALVSRPIAERQFFVDELFRSYTEGMDRIANNELGSLRPPANGISRKFKSDEVRTLKLQLKQIVKRPTSMNWNRAQKTNEQKTTYRQLREAMRLETKDRWRNTFVEQMDETTPG